MLYSSLEEIPEKTIELPLGRNHISKLRANSVEESPETENSDQAPENPEFHDEYSLDSVP